MTMASSPPVSISRRPGENIGRARTPRLVLAQMMVERAAAARALGDHHFAAMPCQQPDRGLVDLRRQHLLRAAGQQRDATRVRAAAREMICGRSRRGGAGDDASGPDRAGARKPAPAEAGERLAPVSRGVSATRKTFGRGSTKPRTRRSHAVEPWPAIGLFDMLRGRDRPDACNSTPDGQVVMQDRQDRQRSICLTTSGGRRAIVLQHVLDEVDAPARAVEFVAEQHIGRAGRGAEAAMHAGAQDLLGRRCVSGRRAGPAVKLVCIAATDPPACGRD